jgi:RNase P/RNase MRP subunit p29
MAATIKAMFPFTEAAGSDATSVAVNSFALSLQPFNSPAVVNGVHGTGLSFNNTNQYLCGDSNTNDGTCDNDTDYNVTTTAFHWQLWFRHSTTAPAAGTDVLVDRRFATIGGAEGVGYTIEMNTSGQIVFGIQDTAATAAYDDSATSTQSFADGQWHHLVAVKSNAAVGLYLYVDGRLVGSDTAVAGTLTLDATQLISIGADLSAVGGANFWDGDIDDVQFSGGGATTTDNLAQSQIRRMYLEGLNAMKRRTAIVTDATTSSTTTIGDSGESWVADEFIGSIVEITGGTDTDCTGVTRRVTSNTATTLTFSPAVPANCTLDTTSDFEVNPEVLYGSAAGVRFVQATPQLLNGDRVVYVGTNDNADGGGVSVLNGLGSSTVNDVYHSKSSKFDSSSTEWTGSNYDEMVAGATGISGTVFASEAGLWFENQDIGLQESMDYLVNNLNSLRLEAVNDVLGGSALEFGVMGGADLAEYYYSNTTLEPGDVVAIQPDQPAGISQSVLPYQSNLLGVVSTSPGITLGPVAENAYPVALAGRIPVKITNENGMIHVGDKITSASKFGYAMKATKAGPVIGTVINEPEVMSVCTMPLPAVEEAVGDGPGVTAAPVDEFGNPLLATPTEASSNNSVQLSPGQDLCGYAMVFIGMSDSLGENIDRLAQQYVDGDFEETDIGGLTTEIADDDPIKTEKQIMAFLEATKASYEDDDKLESIFTDKLAAAVEIIAPSVYTKGLTVDSISSWDDAISFLSDTVFIGRPYFNADTAGFAVILEGAKKVDITFTTPYLAQPVISADIAFENSDSEDFSQEEQFFSAGVDYIVTRKSVNGFTILLNKPAPQDIKFSWIALAVKDPRTVEGAPDGSEQPDEEALPPAEEPSEDLNEENTDNQTDDSNVENSQDGSGGEDTGSVVDETENPVVNEGEGSVTVDPDPVPVNEPSNSGDNASSSETATDGETGSSGAPSDTVNP